MGEKMEKVLVLKRVRFGKKSTPKEEREYQIGGVGPVGTLEEYKKHFPGFVFEIEDNISKDKKQTFK